MSEGWIEMVRLNNGARTIGLFLAAFGIVTFDMQAITERLRVYLPKERPKSML